MNGKKTAALMVSVSMAIFGTLAVFVRNITVSSAELALYRAVLAIALIGVYFLFRGKKIQLRGLGRRKRWDSLWKRFCSWMII